MKRIFISMLALAGLTLAATGCSTFKGQTKAKEPVNNWYLDPATEMVNYKTYGFLQTTACRYQDPVETKYKRSFWKKVTFRGKKQAKRPEIHHTDEIVWRTLQAELAGKGYHQVAPDKADLWVVYYGGPRPSSAMRELGINGGAFDAYFAQNELTEDTFFVDVIDAKTKTLVYRGWDNTTFHKNPYPEPDKVINCATDSISFFPSKM